MGSYFEFFASQLKSIAHRFEQTHQFGGAMTEEWVDRSQPFRFHFELIQLVLERETSIISLPTLSRDPPTRRFLISVNESISLGCDGRERESRNWLISSRHVWTSSHACDRVRRSCWILANNSFNSFSWIFKALKRKRILDPSISVSRLYRSWVRIDSFLADCREPRVARDSNCLRFCSHWIRSCCRF